MTQLKAEEVIRQVEEDRKNLEEIVGYEVVGMAYPSGGINNNAYVADLIKNNTKVMYARTITSTHQFELQEDIFRLNRYIIIRNGNAWLSLGRILLI